MQYACICIYGTDYISELCSVISVVRLPERREPIAFYALLSKPALKVNQGHLCVINVYLPYF